ncbi:unnamed protein product [Acanthoscelides obtectus]|uniref:PiggyBac transposable element-derived protein 4 C-terminal zinc-ribbon domain-containing protein n=1 Tax=Acanthoscelides obtectus TaxID=200917 RepID=A0A9P0PZY2_ACAOB|nr:unnamed protein product [Acanthoscelides obtectus]CAK1641941.1 hypothetical protein AOBTE_LOCUS12741 [Acanthoscelides obtectus]
MFLMQLGEDLTKEHMKRRLEITNLPRNLRQQILEVLDVAETDIVNHVPLSLETRGNKRCSVCPRTLDRKGRDTCITCKRNLCAEHRQAICAFCI